MNKNCLLATLIGIFLSLSSSLSTGHPQTDVYQQLQAGLALEPLLQEGLHWITNDNLGDTYPQASVASTEFVQGILKDLNFPNYENIKVVVGDGYAATNSTFIIIEAFLPETNYSVLDSIFANITNASTPEERSQAEQLLFLHIAHLEHEVAHLVQKHSRNRGIALMAISAASYIALAYAQHAFPCLRAIAQESSWPIKTAYALGSGLVLLTLNKIAWHFMVRKQEQLADDAIRAKPDLLRAEANYFYNLHEDMRTYVQNHYGKRMLELCDNYPSLYQIFDFHHPTHLVRAKKFHARCDAATAD